MAGKLLIFVSYRKALFTSRDVAKANMQCDLIWIIHEYFFNPWDKYFTFLLNVEEPKANSTVSDENNTTMDPFVL